MPLRRPHVKSRHGCTQCKGRKVRCDLQKPTCGHCTRREETCSFTESYSKTPPSIGPSEADSLSSDSFNLRDMELLHHFTTSTYLTLSEDLRHHQMWQVDVPKEGLRHTHLLHCILAVSALHLSASNGPDSESYRAVAIRYHNSALSTFRVLLGNITPENCHALFACSSLVVVFTTAFSIFPSGHARAPAIDEVTELCELSKGATVLVKSVPSILKKGILAPMLSPLPWDGAAPLPEPVTDALRALARTIEAFPETNTNKPIYLAALDTLQNAFKACSFNPDHPLIVFLWYSLMQRSFLDLLRTRDMMALVLLAHHAVILHSRRELWWLGDRGYLVLKDVLGNLEPNWRPLIHWPMRQVGLVIRDTGASCTTDSPLPLPG